MVKDIIIVALLFVIASSHYLGKPVGSVIGDAISGIDNTITTYSKEQQAVLKSS